MSVSARSRLLLAQYGVIIAIIVFVIGLGALGMAWSAYTDERIQTTTQEVDVEEYSVSTQTEAVVDDDVDPELYTPGETLVDMPVYFFNESPELSLIVQIDTPEGETVDVDARLTVEVVAERDGEVFWDEVELLAFEETTVRDGEVEFTGAKDMREVAVAVDRINERIGGAGSVDGQFVLDVEYESDRYAGTLSTDSEIVFTQGAFWLDEELAAEQTESRTETVEQSLGPDMGQVSLFGLVGVLALLGGLGILGALRRGIDTEQLETDLARDQYDEWISQGEIPTRGERDFVAIDSLVDLVDIAIDSNKRVIYQKGIDTYAVIEGDIIYFYSPSREEIEEWFGV